MQDKWLNRQGAQEQEGDAIALRSFPLPLKGGESSSSPLSPSSFRKRYCCMKRYFQLIATDLFQKTDPNIHWF